MSIKAYEVQNYADANQCSLMEAKIAVTKRDRIERLEDIIEQIEFEGISHIDEHISALVQLMLEQERLS